MDNYIGIGKIDGGDNICILGESRIQVVKLTYGFTAGWVPGDD